MKQTLLLLAMFITTVTFAQNSQIKVKQPGKKPFVTYETEQVIISFEKDAFIAAFNETPKMEPDKQSFQAAVDRFTKTGKTIRTKEIVDESAKEEQHFFSRTIQGNVGFQLLITGNAAVYDKKTKTNVAFIEKRQGMRIDFLLPGAGTPFFQYYEEPSEIPTIGVVMDTDDAIIVEEVAPSRADENILVEAPVEAEREPEDPDRIYTVVEQAPEYPGGAEKLVDYLRTNLKRPAECEGTVYVAFVVDKDGSLLEHTVIKGLAPACDEEALRVIRSSGKWVPGRQNGKTVKVRFVWPVKFKTY